MGNLDVLYPAVEIEARVQELGEEISKRHPGEELVLVAIRSGGWRFREALLETLEQIDVVGELTRGSLKVKSYRGAATKSSGDPVIEEDLDVDVTNKKVLIVEDVLETGRTLEKVTDHIQARGPDEMEVCVLLQKPDHLREVEIPLSYPALDAPDRFVVGFGTDHDGRYRDLPFVAMLDPSQTQLDQNSPAG